MGGRAEASAFKDLFQPPHPFHSREQIFNSGWSPQPFPPQRFHVTSTLIKGRPRRASFWLSFSASCIMMSIIILFAKGIGMRTWMGLGKNLSFKRKLLVYSVLLSLVPVFIMGTVSSYMTTSSILDEVEQNHRIILKQLAAQVDSFMSGLDRSSLQLANDKFVLNSLATNVSMENLESTLNMMDVVHKSISDSDVNFQVSLYYTSINELYSSSYGIIRELSYPYNEIVQLLKSRFNGSIVIPPNTYENVPELILTRAIPLNSKNPQGYLMLHLDIHNLTRFINQLDLGGNRKVLIIDNEKNVVTSKDYRDMGTQLTSSSELYPFWEDPNKRGFISLENEKFNVSTIKSTFNNWTYIAMTPAKELTQKSDKIRYIMWSIMLCLCLVWLMIAIIGTRRLYFPIQGLIGKFSPEGRDERDGLQVIETYMGRMRETNEHLQSQLKEHKPYLKESILQQLLSGEISNRDIRKFTEEYGLPLSGNWFYVCVVDIDHYETFQKMYKEKDRSLMMYALRNMIEELSEPLTSYVSVTPKPGQVVLIVGLEEAAEASVQVIVQISHDIRENVRKYFEFTVSVVISNAREEYASIYESYQETLGFLEYRWVIGPNQNIRADKVEPSLKQSSREMVNWKTAVVSSIVQGNFEKAGEQLSEMIGAIPRSLQNSETILGLFANLIGEIDNYLNELGYELNDMFEYDVLAYLYQASSLDEVRQWMTDTVLAKVQNHLHHHNLSKQKKIIPQVLLYIQEHYETDLSLQMLADHFDVSPSMLSRMFKEETNGNYMDYIIQFRMDKAKEWLIHTELSIKEITDRLRYTSVQNFTRIFKQITGFPPGNFRKMHRDKYDGKA
ncbi:helix-turn-helix domain-containing protein [Paenibacillus eucommiae]|uniref:YesN/AraC family two-component response regulator n=1 Tax=Paenibacillus eucommiae TaxID=1355755 RepID=A0ABS4IQZ3_9BACL|nr:helix-turn-helix domain-containing protein [Paenibacillus eucommiae]MBP1989024.1 YesN/AraC family two-component response regulator [Paenibacillus eucommiae]